MMTAQNNTLTAAPNDAATAAPVSPSVEPVTINLMNRLYNPNSGEHFYTASVQEREILVGLGWTYEGIGWSAPSISNTPVYRMYNPTGGEHHYTTSEAERDILVSNSWNYEGIGWYSDDALGVPLYRQYNPNAYACNHNYTRDINENNYLVGLGWNAEGIGWYGVVNPNEPDTSSPLSKTMSDLNTIVTGYLTGNGVDTSRLGVYITDLQTYATYSLNSDTYFPAASTYKLPLAVYYYDGINNGTIDPNQFIGGSDGIYPYTDGSILSLLQRMIQSSDNSAAHVLYNNLGGWNEFKKGVARYSSHIADTTTYYGPDNVFTAAYMNDVLSYIARNRSALGTLIGDMHAALPTTYLNLYVPDGTMAQKYGYYDGAVNSMGLSVQGHQYTIAVFTNNLHNGEGVIGGINKTIYDYFN